MGLGLVHPLRWCTRSNPNGVFIGLLILVGSGILLGLGPGLFRTNPPIIAAEGEPVVLEAGTTVLAGQSEIGPGELVTVPVTLSLASGAVASTAALTLKYDPSIAIAQACSLSDSLFGFCNVFFDDDRLGLDALRVSAVTTSGMSGDLRIAEVVFRGRDSVSKAPPQSSLDLMDALIADADGQEMPEDLQPGLLRWRDKDAAPPPIPDLDCAGNLIFFDQDNDGWFDEVKEYGIVGVEVGLYADINQDGVMDEGDPLVDQTQSSTTGRYQLCAPGDGDYFVVVPPTNFEDAGPLGGMVSSSGNDVVGRAPGPEDGVDHDDNGNPRPGLGVSTDVFARGGAAQLSGMMQDPMPASAQATLDMSIDLGFTRDEPPTVALLEAFDALRPAPGLVRLDWTSLDERRIAGFHLWRRELPTGTVERMTAQIIPSRGGSTVAQYSRLDRPDSQGIVAYWVDVVDQEGVSTRHGPVEVDMATPLKGPGQVWLPLQIR
jgi:hypothetical protein